MAQVVSRSLNGWAEQTVGRRKVTTRASARVLLLAHRRQRRSLRFSLRTWRHRVCLPTPNWTNLDGGLAVNPRVGGLTPFVLGRGGGGGGGGQGGGFGLGLGLTQGVDKFGLTLDREDTSGREHLVSTPGG